MATDFFDRQDHARRQTRRLLVMFALAVVVIILVIYILAAIGAANVEAQHHAGPPAPRTLWNPALFLGVALGTLLVITVGSLYKIAELAAGGEAVALMLGGRAVNPQTQDLAERRLLNVVEEMALASGIPVPPVYVLDREPGINAFAAGHQPGDAVVAVSAGCLKYLKREELQGVMGHEFSHILNGDMRLNLRLIGIVNGILVLAIIGYYVMRSANLVSSRDEKNGGGAVAVLIIGLTLCVLGYLGVLLGNIIKSAISRQREFLADASSVQFTRNPEGIAGALKKIGGLSAGSRIRDAHAQEVSHMFFGDAFAGSFFNLFATHPPLEQRIRALEPAFDGKFPEVQSLTDTAADVAASTVTGRPASFEKLGRVLGGAAALPGVTPAAMPAVMALGAGNVAERIGQPQIEHLQHAGRMMGGMPQPLLEAAREPFAARAVIYSLLLSDDEAVRGRQMQTLQGQIEPPLLQQVQRLDAAVQSLAPEARLPLADLAVPALKNSSMQQYGQFRKVVEALVAADGQVDLFEYCLRVVLFGYLDVHFGLKKPPAIRYRAISAVAQPAAVVLSMLAYVGQDRPEDIDRAFQAGAEKVLGPAAIVPQQQCTFQAFDAALAELAQSSPGVKRRVIDGVTACIAADGQVTLEESELLRAVAAALGCPMPPMAAAA